MIHRITVIGVSMFGVAAASFWVIIIPYLKIWNPSRYTLGFIIICIAAANILGLVYLVQKRDDHGRWLIASGLLGNDLSLFIIVFSLAGSFFLEYVFRM